MADIRCFIAIEIDGAIIEALAGVQQQLRQSGAAVGWVRPASIHITLKFLGDVAEERLPAIGGELAEIAGHHAPFQMMVTGAGAFPSLRRPRIIWAGISDGAENVAALAQEIETRLEAFGFAREARPFTPHITLGRVKEPVGIGALATLIEQHTADQFGVMPVAQLTLMRSELSPQGARYTALGWFPLGLGI